MNLIVDVHAHLDYPTIIGRLPEMIQNAKDTGVYRIITNGLDKVTNRKTLEIAKKYDIVLPALGIYPPDALKREVDEAVKEGHMSKEIAIANAFDVDEEIEFIKKNIRKLAAIGEIGLDYKNGEKKNQEHAFCTQVELAMKHKLPILVHSRKAEADATEILESYDYKKTIMHCFSGKKKLIKKGIDAGFSYSIPTNIVKSHHFQNMAEMLPLSKILTETDAPFLSPFPDTPNEPAFIVESLKKIAEIKKITVEETKGTIFMNYRNLFE